MTPDPYDEAELDAIDLTDDPVLALDGKACPNCRGTMIAYPTEVGVLGRLRCRDCKHETVEGNYAH